MLQVIQDYKSGQLSVLEVPVPSVAPGSVLVRTHSSVISAGTERTTVQTAQRSLLGKAQSRPDLVQKVIRMARTQGIRQTLDVIKTKLETQVPLGYSCAGVVMEVSSEITEFAVGDRVACAGQGYASHAEVVCVPKNLVVKLPDVVDFDSGAYATLGAIALQGVRQAEVQLGDIVCVSGLGLLGLLTVQLLKAAGCRILGLDPDPRALEKALEMGAHHVFSPTDDWQPVVETETAGYGVDCTILCAATSSNAPIVTAGQMMRDKGRLVIVGAVPADVPRSPFYEKEIDVRFSRSYGPGRYDIAYEEAGVDYPYGYVRWTENRNMQSFLGLVASGAVDLRSVTSHRYKIENASEAYKLITGTAERPFGVLLEYAHRVREELSPPFPVQSTSARPREGVLQIGFIGAGNFAQNFLLPHLRKMKKTKLAGVCTSKGISAQNVAKRFKFTFATTRTTDILDHAELDAVFVATRHNLHAPLAVDAMRRNKAVFVEKPLAIHADELQDVVNVQRETQGRIMVGFNRRFAPAVAEVRKFFEKRLQPAIVHYRINAGFIPRDHWTQDPIEGGGRIIGEVCHFVDLVGYLTNSVPVKLYAEVISSTREDLVAKDNVSVTIKYRDGSIGHILYIAVGDRSYPKERLEMFSEQSVAVIDDFRSVTLSRHGKSKVLATKRQDKGHRHCLDRFLHSVRTGKDLPIPFQESVNATIVTFHILESLQCGLPVNIRLDDRQQLLNKIVNRFNV